MRSSYKIIDIEYPYFITSTIVNNIKVFSTDKYFQLLLDEMNFYQKKYDLEFNAFVIMPDHFHAVCSSPQLSKAVQHLKRNSAQNIIRELELDKSNEILNNFKTAKLKHKVKSDHQVWQESYHPKQIYSTEVLNQKINYIHFNPVKKGLVEKPEDWKYSSARFYSEGIHCGLEITAIR